jgi:hypothetical protein
MELPHQHHQSRTQTQTAQERFPGQSGARYRQGSVLGHQTVDRLTLHSVDLKKKLISANGK